MSIDAGAVGKTVSKFEAYSLRGFLTQTYALRVTAMINHLLRKVADFNTLHMFGAAVHHRYYGSSG